MTKQIVMYSCDGLHLAYSISLSARLSYLGYSMPCLLQFTEIMATMMDYVSSSETSLAVMTELGHVFDECGFIASDSPRLHGPLDDAKTLLDHSTSVDMIEKFVALMGAKGKTLALDLMSISLRRRINALVSDLELVFRFFSLAREKAVDPDTVQARYNGILAMQQVLDSCYAGSSGNLPAFYTQLRFFLLFFFLFLFFFFLMQKKTKQNRNKRTVALVSLLMKLYPAAHGLVIHGESILPAAQPGDITVRFTNVKFHALEDADDVPVVGEPLPVQWSMVKGFFVCREERGDKDPLSAALCTDSGNGNLKQSLELSFCDFLSLSRYVLYMMDSEFENDFAEYCGPDRSVAFSFDTAIISV
jgi:hypothetical protein